jgi:hypothetical protein
MPTDAHAGCGRARKEPGPEPNDEDDQASKTWCVDGESNPSSNGAISRTARSVALRWSDNRVDPWPEALLGAGMVTAAFARRHAE